MAMEYNGLEFANEEELEILNREGNFVGYGIKLLEEYEKSKKANDKDAAFFECYFKHVFLPQVHELMRAKGDYKTELRGLFAKLHKVLGNKKKYKKNYRKFCLYRREENGGEEKILPFEIHPSKIEKKDCLEKCLDIEPRL